jgi:transketolase
MPSMEIFAAQSPEYRDSVLIPGVKRVAIEAAHPMSWYKWVGDNGVILGLDHFGASAPAPELFKHFGLTVEKVVEAAQKLIS